MVVRRRAGGASGLVAFVFLAWASQQAEAAETCSARGFSSLQLCSDCEIFAQHVTSSKELVADCFDCCAQDSAQNDGTVKYVRAVLEICN
ncbi:hypothetical protein HKI87_14g76510 [Chloropicon roscoffensis]|uniref:Selenoprotein F/M domain-containing protein n=1 Tax=Chloropicon roscoffensis TaxID=1461544 RepID=A0AAX4PJP5_9CHLO